MRRDERNDKIRNDFFKEAKKLSISLDRKNGINRYTFITFDFLKEMHVWAAWNGVASAEKGHESSSFDQKKHLQEKLTPQR